MPTISAIIPTFNAAPTIGRALESALAQSLPCHEIIIVDDCSSDNTLAVVEAFQSRHPSIQIFKQEVNQGPAAARNRAIAAATGDWVAILDSDDAWAPERNAALMDVAQGSGADMVADNILLFDLAAGRENRVMMALDQPLLKLDTPRYWLGSRIGAPQFSMLKGVLRREFLARNGLVYDEAARIGEDLIFYGELLALGGVAVVTNHAFYLYTTRVGEISGKSNTHSHTNMNFLSICHRIDAFLDRRQHLLTQHGLIAVRKCRSNILTGHRLNEYRKLRSAQPMKGLIAMLTDPAAILLTSKMKFRQWKIRKN